MNKRVLPILTGLCGLIVFTLCAAKATAQTDEVKPKPPMLSYVANWQFPRANWADVEKTNSSINPVLDKALADGTIVGYGVDKNLVHTVNGETHDNWWSAMSMAALVKVLNQVDATGVDSSPVILSATKHWDDIFVSRYYNWKSGPYKSAYTHVGAYKFKEDAPDDALDTLAQHMIVPLLEQQLANGTILEYEIDTMAIHTQPPGTFWIVYLTPTPEGLDTVQAAVRDAAKAHPLSFQAFDSETDDTGHRDELLKSDGTYK